MASVDLIGIGKRFGTTEVLRDVSLRIADGEFLAILGPSGCGKSTLLRILAGLEGADRGEVRLGDARVDQLPPKARNLAMVFQSYALYPYMTVRQNIALPLEMRRLSALQRLPLLGRLLPGTALRRRAIAEDVAAAAEPLQLTHLLERRPAQLSGGQRQRVALARAMVRHPAAFLMDEPLSNLDTRLRTEARAEIMALRQRLGATILYVTHDQAEAMAMADRVAVMQGGRVLQLAPPQELYDEPASLEVARFVGSPPMNAIPARIGAEGRVEAAGFALPWRSGLVPGTQVTLGVRAEALVPAAQGLPVRVERVERLGAEALMHGALSGSGEMLVARLEAAQIVAHPPGTSLLLMPSRAVLFDAGGDRLPMTRLHDATIPSSEPAYG
ncbi:ABC transporter ATP-binding protein [Siccirubricoccus sp. KC 17139]|uniref:ABC transporter ATP-binding protein n=1 Tax=Siccirubricoccus soli TaxID=2899147 RepID=A0ABT1CYB6_9PROT|nr:ABC transporter ATP-binding protein [Siccirubricoccus soli]MCO6414648.1 ABC transporter ATP-binding protein [Siccirubricoccus soli]MCP2680778.1 ABC transporter ATP-binding protein [Siccirubricoccus soli]